MGLQDSNILVTELQRRYGTANWSKANSVRFPMYDYIRYPAAGTTSLQFFTIPLGGVDPNSSTAKTLEQTNFNTAAKLGAVNFLATQIRTHLCILPKGRQPSGITADTAYIYQASSNAMAKFIELIHRGVLNVQFGNRGYWQIENPFQNCPPGFGVDVQQHASSYVAAASLWTKGSQWALQNSEPNNIYKQLPPQWIEGDQTIQATIDFPDGTSPVFTSLVDSVDIRIECGLILDGYQIRPAA